MKVKQKYAFGLLHTSVNSWRAKYFTYLFIHGPIAHDSGSRQDNFSLTVLNIQPFTQCLQVIISFDVA